MVCFLVVSLLILYSRLFCLVLLLAYVPQYFKVYYHGTVGLSSRYILYHALFSTAALAFRLCILYKYYGAFNCVNNGELRGWKAFSALLGFFQAIVQWICAITL